MPQTVKQISRACPICSLPTFSPSEYCEMHTIAKSNLDSAYLKWRTAFDSIPTKEFLERISNLPEAGDKVKEVARYLLKK